jgi:hypothetical protein
MSLLSHCLWFIIIEVLVVEGMKNLAIHSEFGKYEAIKRKVKRNMTGRVACKHTDHDVFNFMSMMKVFCALKWLQCIT